MAWRLFLVPAMTYCASVDFSVPVSVVKELDSMCCNFLFGRSAVHPALEVASEDLNDGGLTRHGGAGPVAPCATVS